MFSICETLLILYVPQQLIRVNKYILTLVIVFDGWFPGHVFVDMVLDTNNNNNKFICIAP